MQVTAALDRCPRQPGREERYNRAMDEPTFTALSAWLTQAGLAGMSESEIVTGLCERCVAAGLPLGRAQVFIDTLHPVHEGRLFRWGHGPAEAAMLEYGRTSPDALAASGADPRDIETAARWRNSPFFRMLQTGDTLLRRRLNVVTEAEFSFLPDWLAAGMTDYVAIITRFAAEGTIGEMDAVYSSWATQGARRLYRRPDRGARAHRALPRARHQIGIARAHDRNADGNLSRPRRRPARARRTDHARHGGKNRRRGLVQRFARLYADHRHGAGTGHSIAQ